MNSCRSVFLARPGARSRGSTLVGIGYAQSPALCGLTKIRRAVPEIRAVRAKFDDASALAGSTSRIALSGPVAQLQAIRREAEALVVPRCLAPARAELVAAISEFTDAMMLFMANSDDEVAATQAIAAKFRSSNTHGQLEAQSIDNSAIVCSPAFCPR